MVDLNKLKEKYASLAQQGGGNNQDFLDKFFMLKEGEAGVRILPWDRDDQDFYAETAIHRINGKNYHCPRVKDQECPVCDGYHAIWKQINATGGRDAGNNSQLAELARGIKANKRFYMNVIDRRTDDVKILSMGQKLFTKILSYLLNDDYIDEGKTVIDLAKGNDFKVVKKMIGGYPNYDESAFRPKKTPAMESEGRIHAAMEQLHDIHSLVRVAEYSELKTLTDEAMAMVDMISGNTSSSPAAESSSEQGEDDYLSHLPKLDL